MTLSRYLGKQRGLAAEGKEKLWQKTYTYTHIVATEEKYGFMWRNLAVFHKNDDRWLYFENNVLLHEATVFSRVETKPNTSMMQQESYVKEKK